MAANARNKLYDWLRMGDLQRYYPKFKAEDIDEDRLLMMDVPDYKLVGITSASDKAKLQLLIHTLKTEGEEGLIRKWEKERPKVEEPTPPVDSTPRKRQPVSRPMESKSAAPTPKKDRPRPKEEPVAVVRSDEYVQVAASAKSSKARIRVAVRKRPLMTGDGDKDIVSVRGMNCAIVHEPKVRVDMSKYIEEHEFIFDEVFHEDNDNVDVYTRTAKNLIPYVFKKGRATVFAYGQTGSGKTYTMMGKGDGLYVQAARDIFHHLNKEQNLKLSVWVSFFEIYSGSLYDLLNDRAKLFAREDANHKVQIAGIVEKHVDDEVSFLELMDYGNTVRSTAATGANADSSRSHAILQIDLKDRKGKLHGKLSFIDLAGSERASDTTDNDRQRRMEGAEINKSLLALKECIRALDQEKSHTPFRQSKLTQVLKDSFVGDSRTVMVACISPDNLSSEHTLNTLRYADRVKELKRGAGGKVSGAPPPNDARYERVMGGGGPRSDPSQAKKAQPKRRVVPAAAPASDPVPSTNVEELVETHAELVTTILSEKEDIILAHRQQIDDMMEIVKQEMKLLHSVDKPGSAVDDYVATLDTLLSRKADVISTLRRSLAGFKEHLQEEETLSKSLEKSLPRVKNRR